MTWDQIGILCTGVVAIFLSQCEAMRWRRWSPLFGMAGQPFWFYAAWHAGQWGIVVVTVLYTASWAKGIWTFWLRPRGVDTLFARLANGPD